MLSLNETNVELRVNEINCIGMMFIRCYCLLMIPLGIIGHSLSIFVFTRRSLRSNPCVMYLLSATIFGLLSSSFILPMRLLQAGYIGMNPAHRSNAHCKIIWFLLNLIRSLSFWLIVLACIDRYLCSSSSVTKRSWSSTHVAGRAIPLTILICFIAYIHIPIVFKISIVPSTRKSICHGAGPTESYRKFSSIYNLIPFGLCPPLCMLIFGMLTLRNINRKKLIKMISSTNLKSRKRKRYEKQFFRMLFAQVLVYSITGLAFSITLMVVSVNKTREKSLLKTGYENLVIVIVGMLSNAGPCSSFCLFTLSSQLFRKELNKLFNRLIRNGIQSKTSRILMYSTDRVLK